MNIPMLNEINKNTNAAKNEILKAMPSGGGLLVPDSYTFVKVDPETSLTAAVNVTGKGRFLGSISSTNGYVEDVTQVVVVLDGKEICNDTTPRFAGFSVGDDAYLIDLVFVKSLVIKTKKGVLTGKTYSPVVMGRIEHYV